MYAPRDYVSGVSWEKYTVAWRILGTEFRTSE